MKDLEADMEGFERKTVYVVTDGNEVFGVYEDQKTAYEDAASLILGYVVEAPYIQYGDIQFAL